MTQIDPEAVIRRIRKRTFNAAIDRSATAARSYAVDGPCRIACWAASSVDDLIRPLQQWPRNLEAECAGGSLIDDQVVLGGLLDGEVGWLGAP